MARAQRKQQLYRYIVVNYSPVEMLEWVIKDTISNKSVWFETQMCVCMCRNRQRKKEMMSNSTDFTFLWNQSSACGAFTCEKVRVKPLFSCFPECFKQMQRRNFTRPARFCKTTLLAAFDFTDSCQGKLGSRWWIYATQKLILVMISSDKSTKVEVGTQLDYISSWWWNSIIHMGQSDLSCYWIPSESSLSDYEETDRGLLGGWQSLGRSQVCPRRQLWDMLLLQIVRQEFSFRFNFIVRVQSASSKMHQCFASYQKSKKQCTFVKCTIIEDGIETI